jgi:hypothetical protein
MQFLNFPFSSSYLMFGDVPDEHCLPGSKLHVRNEVRKLDIMIEQNWINFCPPAGYGEGNKKTSWWSHCSSQGKKHDYSCSFEIFLQLFLFVACVLISFAISKDTLLNIFKLLMVIFFFNPSNISRRVQCLILLNSLPMCMRKVMELRYSFFPPFLFIFCCPLSLLLLFLVSSILRPEYWNQSLNAMRYQLIKI